MTNRDWLEKCLNAAEILYGVFPIGVLERLYGRKLDRDETIKVAEGKFDYIDSNLDEFEALGYTPGYFTPTIYEDGEEYAKYKAQGDKLHISERIQKIKEIGSNAGCDDDRYSGENISS